MQEQNNPRVAAYKAQARFPNVGFSVPIPLPPFYRDRLASTSVEELLTLFTGYLSSRVNVLEDCLTMRGQGEVHKKKLWYKDCIVGKSQPWSLSVEVRGR